MTAYALIERQDDLENLAVQIKGAAAADIIALDTEFLRVKTFYPQLCLIQLCLRGEVFLVDPFPLDISPLMLALHECQARIITFSGVEDWECLSYEFLKLGFKDAPLVRRPGDVQLLAAFANHSWMRGLGVLAEDLLGITLAKDQTRSDWQKRPLQLEQLEYAALDVVYLERMHELLKARMSPEIFAFYEEEAYERAFKASCPENDGLLYRKAGGAGRLSLKDLHILRELLIKRGELARHENIAPNRIVPQGELVNIVMRKPRSKQALLRFNLKPACVFGYGDRLLGWLAEAQRADDLDKPLLPPYDACTHQEGYSQMISALRPKLKEACAQHQIAESLLDNKKLINYTLTSYQEGIEAGLLSGWKAKAAGDIRSFLDISLNPSRREAAADDSSVLSGVEAT